MERDNGQNEASEIKDLQVKWFFIYKRGSLNDIIYKIKGTVVIIKVSDDSQLDCASCKVLQYYANLDVFRCPIECIFCSKIIQNENQNN